MESSISASLGAMGPLLRKLDMLLLEPSVLRLQKGAKRWTHLLKDDLEEISSYLQDLSEVEDPPLTAKCWMKEVRELSYNIENYIDSFVLPGHVATIKTRSGHRRRRRRCCLSRIRVRQIKITRLLETNKKLNRRKRVAARISDFRMDAREALDRYKRYELHCCASIRRVLSPGARRLPTWEEGAGIIVDDRMRKFMDSMADDRDPQLKVVSVVGSEGMGKTTLVKVLYHKLKGQFDCRAFIRLTQKPDIKKVLRDILTQVQKQQPHNHCDDPELLGKIREHLQYKRYLIVIDDLWSASIWDVISYAFPEGRMCSRVIISTQIEDVALGCCCYHSEYVFRMTPLDDDLSRELFLSSLFFPERDFPQKLKEVLNKIVKICSGLPLATTVIASVLATHPVISMEQWTYIYDSLSSKLRIGSSPSEGMKLLVNFSYNNLTCHLKTSLLYLSIYPEGYTVCKDDLVKQWVAEGFIDGTEGREVETAESYFHELIGRRFIQPACIKYTGEVVSCSIPAVVRDLIAQKALEENFVVVLDHYRRNVSLSEKVHRLSLHFPHTKYAMTNIRASQVRSVTCFGLSKCMPSLREFKLLRVLNLNLSGHGNDNEDIIDLTWICELSQLRYLKVASDICIKLPKHMGGLQYLETVDIGKKVTYVPSDIIHLPRLLYLHLPFETNLMDRLDLTAGPVARVWSFGKPTDLQHLYLTCFIPVPDHLHKNILSILGSLFRGLGRLKTLAFIISSAHKSAVAHGCSEETVSWDWDDFALPLLERFEWMLHSCSLSRVPKWIGKLGNLCILKISVRELMRDGVNILGELPALTILSLYVKILSIERIIFDKSGFLVLKYFKLKCSTVPWLKFEVDAMPNLQKLKLGFSAHSHRVDQQNTVPISIEHLPGLKEISAKVADASSDAESALMATVSNDPRNPRIRMQLVDWNSYGHGVWYTVRKQEKPLDVEEDKIPDPEEGLYDHCAPQYKNSRDDQNKEAYVSVRDIPLQATPSGYNLWTTPAATAADMSSPPQQAQTPGAGVSAVLSLPSREAAPPVTVAAVADEGKQYMGVAATSQGQMVMSSKYLKAAQELLDEVVSVSKGVEDANKPTKTLAAVKKEDSEGVSGGGTEDGSGTKSGSSAPELSTAERQELQMKKSKLINMLDEVEQRYRQYHGQMQAVSSLFEAAAGAGSARTYTALALRAMSRHFRCLHDAIASQVRAASRALGEDADAAVAAGGRTVGSRLRYIDHQLRQQRALQQLGMMQGGAWRPQRGLPERSVSILRAWLFEHFLHPYPKDSDKIMLAKQTGLTCSQVSNWFINARVRLWKPMVEEMYLEETKEQDGGGGVGNDEGKSGAGGSKSGDTADGVTPRADAMSKSAVSASTSKGVHGSSLLELGGDHQNSHAGFYDDEDDGDHGMGRWLKKARGDEPAGVGAFHHSYHVHDMAALHAQAAAAARQQHEEVSHRELLMKFMESGGGGAGARDHHHQHHQDGGGGYSLFAPGPYGQFATKPGAFAGNGGVSLTLGLPHGAAGGSAAEQTASFLMGSTTAGAGSGSHGSGAGGYTT